MTDTNPYPVKRPERSVTANELEFIASRVVAGDWVRVERRDYADHKYDAEKRHQNDLDMHTFGLGSEGTWFVFLTNYLRRAQLLGVDTLAGRQAFGKFLVTAMSAFESMIRTEGKPPQPGVASGVINEWKESDG